MRSGTQTHAPESEDDAEAAASCVRSLVVSLTLWSACRSRSIVSCRFRSCRVRDFTCRYSFGQHMWSKRECVDRCRDRSDVTIYSGGCKLLFWEPVTPDPSPRCYPWNPETSIHNAMNIFQSHGENHGNVNSFYNYTDPVTKTCNTGFSHKLPQES